MTTAQELLALARRASRPVVLIDGRSGAGKTTLADAIAPALGAQLVRLDDLYPGWDGLEAGSAQVRDEVLAEHPRWRRWDWNADAAAEWHELDAALPLVVEGAGSLTRATRRRATLTLWAQLDTPTRKLRALARDGGGYAPHWDRWAAQEDAFIAREHPRELADLVLDDAEIAAIVRDLPESVDDRCR